MIFLRQGFEPIQKKIPWSLFLFLLESEPYPVSKLLPIGLGFPITKTENRSSFCGVIQFAWSREPDAISNEDVFDPCFLNLIGEASKFVKSLLGERCHGQCNFGIFDWHRRNDNVP